MAETLQVAKREQLGSSRCRRLRAAGQIPAVLYGHGEGNLNLAVAREQFASALRHGAKLVDLQGEVNESALIRDVQWDPFGVDVLHVDLARVSASELVEVTLTIELRGDAPGVRDGGNVQHVLHEAKIECPAGAIPERLQLNVNSLGLGQSLLAGQIPLPEGARLLTNPDVLVVHCVTTTPESDEAVPVPGEAAEPEVIGRKKDEEEGAEE